MEGREAEDAYKLLEAYSEGFELGCKAAMQIYN